jgi:hypothetical protein
MTRFNYWKCDECGKILENIECNTNQLLYTLIANYDTENGRYKAHFCSKKCLQTYIETKVKEHYELPQITDGDRPEEFGTLGEMWNEQEKPCQ